MRIIIFALLLAMLLFEETAGISDEDKGKLAEIFSPILILTEEAADVYDEEIPIRVTKPEPVSIISAQSADSIRFKIYNLQGQKVGGIFDWRSFADWNPPPVFTGVQFSQNRFSFAFRGFGYTGRPVIEGQQYSKGKYTLEAYYDYPGTTSEEWNAAYFGEGTYAGSDNDHKGSDYPNTAYVHIDSTTHRNYPGELYVIQYYYFYPYNDWWNNHEGDWQRVDVVVSSSDPDDNSIEVLGVEYRFHGAWVTYYRDFPDHAGLTSSFEFNPEEALKLSQGTHPVVYVGAGSHGAFPVGGTIDMHDITDGFIQRDSAERGVIPDILPDKEYMTHTGKVLSTQADRSHDGLWESYNLVLLPDPDPKNTNNMDLPDTMSWLGAQIRWGTPHVDGPGIDTSPTHGPYNSETNSWGNLKFDEVAELGPPGNRDPFYHEELPYSHYHHWVIIGHETWGDSASASIDTLKLQGDIVVFPGDTLTVERGTVAEFVPVTDRHQFSASGSDEGRAEIFVYGHLIAKGTASDSVRFGSPVIFGAGPPPGWGGIHVMEGGVVSLGHTEIWNTPKPALPTGLAAETNFGERSVALAWDDPLNPSITRWEYQMKQGPADWGDWLRVDPSDWSTTSYTVGNLTRGVTYQFKVQAVNWSGTAESEAVEVTLAGPPGPPEVTASEGHEKVVLSWTPGDANGSAIQRHELRYSGDGGTTWNPDWRTHSVRSDTIGNLINDTEYTFQMRARNEVDYSEVAEVRATPRHPIRGRAAVDFAEHRVDTVATYRFRVTIECCGSGSRPPPGRLYKGRERILRVTTNHPYIPATGEEDTLVEESTIIIDDRAIARGQVESVLETTLREGARRLLLEALELEVEEYSQRFQALRDDKGQRLVVRNGYHQERELVTGVGKVPVRQPRVHDRRPEEHFTSAILPPYLRRTPSIDALIPLLYLKGISTNAFPDALRAILGDGVVGLSATNIVRLKQVWEQEFAAWGQRDLHGQRYVYLWADALYFNVRLEKDRPCVLVVVGATADGHKELLAIQDGERESALSWQHLLQDLKARGLTDNAFLAVADGALGFWKAVEEVFPGVRAQQCWVHKTANVLDKLPKRVRPDAKSLLHEMYLADTRKEAEDACDRFLKLYGPRRPKAAECLEKDRDVLFTFYDFPAAHWVHLRTTNPIESTFATVRHRTRQTRGCGSRITTLTMVFKLATEAEKHWRRLNGHQLIPHLVDGDTFLDGELQLKEAA